jgi:hypothetical protein
MAKKLLQRSEFLKQSRYNSHYRLNENAFVNDVPWGDSIIGRMINSVARKLKINYNLAKMPLLVNQLKKNFDRLVAMSEVNIKPSDIRSIEIYELIRELIKLIEEGADVGDILQVTNQLREKVDSSNLDDKKELLKIIDEFIKFLEQFETDPPSDQDTDDDPPSDEDTGGEGENPPLVNPDSNTGVKIYPLLIKNLKSLSLILSQYQMKKGQRGVAKDESKNLKKFYYPTKGGETIEEISKLTENKFKWAADKIWSNNTDTLKTYEETFKKDPRPYKNDKFSMKLKGGLKIYLGKGVESKVGVFTEVSESFIFENIAGKNPPKPGQSGTGGSVDRGKIKSGEDHLSQAFSKLKKDLDALVDSKTKGVGIDAKFINDITSKAIDSKNKDLIFELYYEVQRYLVGDKKSTMPVRDKLYESIEIISDKRKKVIVAEKIARFATRALQFDGEGLYGGLGDVGKPLEDFVNSIKEIMKIDLKSKEGEKIKSTDVKTEKDQKDAKEEKPTPESVLNSYSKFVNLILEKNANPKEIQDKFNELFTQEVVDKLVPNQEKITELMKTGKNPGGKYIIRDTDPIISIIRLFQRAYRLHTPGAIPSGRKDGKVSVSVFNEYENMGDSNGSPSSPGGGPYRNISLFDSWRSGVEKILADSKYRPIFSEETEFEFESKEAAAAGRPDKGDKIKKGGKMLLKFINKLLNDNEMYKGASRSGEGGALFKFYEEYFGLKLPEDGPGSATPTRQDRDAFDRNRVTAEAVTSANCEWVDLTAVGFKKQNLMEIFRTKDKDSDFKDYKKLAIKFKVKTDKEDRTYYAVIDDFLERNPVTPVLIFSTGGYPFDMAKIKIDGATTLPKDVYYGYISSNDFQVGRNIKIQYINIEDGQNASATVNSIDYKVTEIKILRDKTETDKPYLGMRTRLVGQHSSGNSKKDPALKRLKTHRG